MGLEDLLTIAVVSYQKKLFINAVECFSSVIFNSINNESVLKALFYRGTCYAFMGLIKKSQLDLEEFLKSISVLIEMDNYSKIFASLESIMIDLQRVLNSYVLHGQIQTKEFKEVVEIVKQIHIFFKMGPHNKVKSKSTISYTQQLLEEYRRSNNSRSIMSSAMNGVRVSSDTDLRICLSHKVKSHTWKISVTCEPPQLLHRVALLYNYHLSHFHIQAIYNEDCQVEISPKCHDWEGLVRPNRGRKNHTYLIEFSFNSEMLGTFNQTLIVDFGTRPVLFIPVVVETKLDSEVDLKSNLMMLSKSWDDENSNIVKVNLDEASKQTDGSNKDTQLIKTYRMLNPDTRILDSCLTDHNYIERMHALLYLEENAQFSHLHSRCSNSTIQLVSLFMLEGANVNVGSKFARPGEIFAVLNLPVSLSVDNVVGSIISKSVSKVFIRSAIGEDDKELNESKPTIFEGLIEEKTLKHLYLRLSKKSIEQLNLSCDNKVPVTVQFQLNRLPFCRMHYAVDAMPNICALFPPILAHYIQIKPLPEDIENNLHSLLNLNQRSAVHAAVCDVLVRGTELWFPPVVISGPFGTGKTFTLAQIALTLLKRKNTKILICTQSNSAADLYIKEYFHTAFVNKNDDAKPLRIMYEYRWPKTISEIVYQYSLPSNSSNTYFARPTEHDISKHRIIITTLSTAKYLTDCNLSKGAFTHILLDEAAQALECEIIAPLVAMNSKTRIILAGDHRQILPVVRSRLAADCDFDVSLLQRLFDSYPEVSPFRILLTENYRSHSAIVEFASKWFYKSQLVARGVHTVHSKFQPITFFAARGVEAQPDSSTSFCNVAEALELCERIKEIQATWPESWGSVKKIDDSSIGVVTPYSDQVLVIRSELKRQKIFGVSVENVSNVQGKQYRVLFLSTVRSRTVYDTVIIGGTGKKNRDFGFLSDANLLNTAITRAQSLLAVVGDPTTLCSTGSCRNIWTAFISHCNKSNSLYGITMGGIEEIVYGKQTKNTFRLNPLATDFIPRSPQSKSPTSSESSNCEKEPPKKLLPMFNGKVNPLTNNSAFLQPLSPVRPNFMPGPPLPIGFPAIQYLPLQYAVLPPPNLIPPPGFKPQMTQKNANVIEKKFKEMNLVHSFDAATNSSPLPQKSRMMEMFSSKK